MKVIVWGCGSFGKQIFPNLMVSGKYEVVAYTDNKEELWGRHFQWVPIIAPEQIMGNEFDILLIVVSSPSATEAGSTAGQSGECVYRFPVYGVVCGSEDLFYQRVCRLGQERENGRKCGRMWCVSG